MGATQASLPALRGRAVLICRRSPGRHARSPRSRLISGRQRRGQLRRWPRRATTRPATIRCGRFISAPRLTAVATTRAPTVRCPITELEAERITMKRREPRAQRRLALAAPIIPGDAADMPWCPPPATGFSIFAAAYGDDVSLYRYCYFNAASRRYFLSKIQGQDYITLRDKSYCRRGGSPTSTRPVKTPASFASPEATIRLSARK